MSRFLPSLKVLPNLLILWLAATAFVGAGSARAGGEKRHYWIALPTEEQQRFPLENLRYDPVKGVKVALVLSGGGARGFAHIGVLQALEQYHVPVNLLVGTSMGSIVGGFYAVGFSAQDIRKTVKEINWDEVFADEANRSEQLLSQKRNTRQHLLQFRFDGLRPTIPSSISQGQRVFQTLYNRLLTTNFHSAENFDQLRIPFRAVATDLISGKKVVLDKGDLAEAMNASVSFPLLFAPVSIDGMWLVDGGITDNLPVDVAIQEGADVIIAVDVTSALRGSDEIRAPWEIADQVTSIMMQKPTEESRLLADVVIRPELGDFRSSNFEEADTAINIGYRATIALIDSIWATISRARRKSTPAVDPSMTLASVRWEGLSGVLQDRFSRQFRCLPGARVGQGDILREMRLVHSSGLLQDIRAEVIDDSGSAAVTFHVTEQPKITEVIFQHHRVLSDSVFDNIAAKFGGKQLNIIELFAELEKIKSALFENGYSLATIRKISFHPENGRLEIQIDEGYIDKIVVTGNRVTRTSIVLREFTLKEGQLFQSAQASRGIGRIYSTDLFDRVLINVSRKDDRNILVIKVKERKYFLARLGANVSVERNTNGFLEFLADNFLGRALKVSLFGEVGDFERGAEANIYAVRLFNTYLTPQAQFFINERTDRLYEQFERRENYQIVRRGARFSIGQQIARLGLISAELRLEEIRSSSESSLFPYPDSYQLRTLTFRSVVDKRDRVPYPNKGIYNRWSWETGNQLLLGSSVPFTKLFLGLEGYYPFLKQFNYHLYAFAGTGDKTLPFSEFFFFGGQHNFPGLFERERFGRQYIQGGLDLRYRLTKNLPIEAYLLANYSIGASWVNPDDPVSRSDFIQSISATFAINSILGPLEFTYARLLGERNLFHFSFGFDF